MKLIKALFLSTIAISLAIIICGCIVIPLTKYYKISENEVNSIQFYNLKIADNWDLNNNLDIQPFHTLSNEKMIEFLNDFSKLKFTDSLIITLAAVDPSFSYGEWVIRINYKSGSYSYFSHAGFGASFDSNNILITSTHYGCEKEDMETLIKKYYDISQLNIDSK